MVKTVVRRTSSRALEIRARFAQIADALQHDEGRVPFVQVIDSGLVAHGLQHPHAANAKNDLLLHACLAIATAARREVAVPWRVLFEVGIEQIEDDAPDAHSPDRDEDRPVAERDCRDARLAVGCDSRFDRSARPIQLLVDLLLPSVSGQALMKIALRIHEADADERHPRSLASLQ